MDRRASPGKPWADVDVQTVRVMCLLNDDFSLTVCGGRVVLALANPHDAYQHWIKHNTKKKDKEGQPAFALINKVTKTAMQFPGKGFPMPLVPYDPVSPDKSVLWTLSKDARLGFRQVRWLGDISLMFTPVHDKVWDGANLLLWPQNNRGNNQHWMIEPRETSIIRDLKSHTMTQVNAPLLPHHIFKIYCRTKPDYNLTADKDTDAVMLAQSDSSNVYQKWIKDERYGRHVKDEDGCAAFALVNKATGKAIKHGLGTGHIVRLGAFNPYYLDESLLWRESSSGGFRVIRVHNDASALLHAFHAENPYLPDWALVGLSKRDDSGNQRWNIQEFN